jgi:hypothetical protein
VHAVENAAVREHRPERFSAPRIEEIVGSRPEARWASSNAHRPGASAPRPQGSGLQRRPCVAWLSERRGYSARGRSVAAKAPRSGIERFMGAWIARWLQKSVRSILSRPQPTPKGARRADDERDAAAASWTGKRIRFALRARVRNAARNLHERARRSTRREPSIEPMEGAPDHDASALNQRGPSDPRPHRQNRAPRTSARLGRRRARSAPPKHRCGDTGRQRSRRLVRLPQPKGAGGQPAAVKGIRSRR